MDALPVRESTGLPYASEVTATDADGERVQVMHACGHDVHVACLAGAAQLLAEDRKHWGGTLVAGRVAQDIPVNHSATFAPALQPRTPALRHSSLPP